jgi:hypothetical protein
MPEVCSCGARLVEDALFCHRCGKPQRDLVETEPVEPRVEEAPPAPELIATMRAAAAPAPAPSFHNPVATKIALTVAGVGTLLSFLPYINFIAAGFFAVFFYRRRTGHPLNMESGVRMGWMTGVIMFAIMAVLLTAWVLILRAAGGMSVIPAEFKAALDPRMIEAMNKLLQSGSAVLAALVEMFVFTTLLAMAGGALGAKMTGRS